MSEIKCLLNLTEDSKTIFAKKNLMQSLRDSLYKSTFRTSRNIHYAHFSHAYLHAALRRITVYYVGIILVGKEAQL